MTWFRRKRHRLRGWLCIDGIEPFGFNLKVQWNKFWLGTFISLCVCKWHLRINAIISTINVNLCNAWKYVILSLYFCIDPIQFQIDSIISSKKKHHKHDKYYNVYAISIFYDWFNINYAAFLYTHDANFLN